MRLSWQATNVLFLVCTSLQFVSDGHITAFTPLLLHDLGLSAAEVAVWSGLLFGVAMSVAFPLSPFWRVLAERYSRRLMMVRAYYTMTVVLLVMAWAPNLAVLVLGRIVLGFCYASIAMASAASRRRGRQLRGHVPVGRGDGEGDEEGGREAVGAGLAPPAVVNEDPPGPQRLPGPTPRAGQAPPLPSLLG